MSNKQNTKFYRTVLLGGVLLQNSPDLEIDSSNIVRHAYPYDAVVTLTDSSSPKHRLKPYKLEILCWVAAKTSSLYV